MRNGRARRKGWSGLAWCDHLIEQSDLTTLFGIEYTLTRQTGSGAAQAGG